jgi:hypothetical protein
MRVPLAEAPALARNVMPPGFQMLEASGSSELITHSVFQVDPQDGGQNYLAIARLAPGVLGNPFHPWPHPLGEERQHACIDAIRFWRADP